MPSGWGEMLGFVGLLVLFVSRVGENDYGMVMVTLAESRFSHQLGFEEQRLLARLAEPRHFPAGHRVFNEGDLPDGLYVVHSGVVEITVLSSPGREHVLSRMEPGDYFGEMAVFDGGMRSASATTKTEVGLSFVSTQIVRTLLDRSPMLAASLVRDASLRMREFNRRFLQESLRAERLTLVERLARTIVHDFRNPLNVIGIAADMAAEESLGLSARKSARDRIRQQVEVLNSLMQELLDFTRTPAANVALPRLVYADVLRKFAVEWDAEASRRGIQLQLPVEWPLMTIRLDPNRLTRVFNNLLQNAFDALSCQADGQIRIQCVVHEDHVVTEVRDNGSGVPKELLEHIFQPFVTFGKEHGTGLGLAICERIVAEHGGVISVENLSPRGACFRFTLPKAA